MPYNCFCRKQMSVYQERSVCKEENKKSSRSIVGRYHANMALKTANRGYVMETGRITLEGTGAELLNNEAVKAAYLGT